MKGKEMKQKYSIQGMSCASCSAHVDKAVRELKGVKDVNVNLLSASMVVEFDDNICNDDTIIKAVKSAGYGASLFKKEVGVKDNSTHELKLLITAFVFLIVLMYVSMGHMISLPLPSFLTGHKNAFNFALTQLILVTPILIIYRRYFISGYKKLFKGGPNMDSLIAISATASIVYGIYALVEIAIGLKNNDMELVKVNHENLYFESAGMILTLVSFGKYLESLSKKKTTSALTKMMDLSPKKAILESGNEEVEVLASDLRVNDVIIVKKGMVIPIDGKIISGSGSIDQANITGESMPVYKSVGDEVFSATTLTNGYLKISAEKVGEDTSFAGIIRLVEEASNSKAPISKLADKIAGIFVPIVMGIALLTFAISYLVGKDFNLSFNFAISVLVIACPCSLGLATPVAIMVGTGKGAENGLLIKNAEILEKAGSIKTVVLDKTGTITEGHPEVVDFIKLDSGADVLGIVNSFEALSEHPLAVAITNYAKKRYAQTYDVKDYETLEGKGISGVIDNKKYYVGNERILVEKNLLDEKLKQQISTFSKEGKTVLSVLDEKNVLGLITIKDQIKKTSKDAIKELKKEGIEVVMLTGDNKETASKIAFEVGVDKVIAEVFPQDKEKVIEGLKKDKKHLVAMVGDGVNDALALTKADLGIAIGAGSDVAKDSSDIILLRSDLMDVLNVIMLSRRVLKTIKGNLFWAFFYNCIGIILASGLLYAPFSIKLNPMIGSLAMSLSSVFVVCNALTINFFKVKSQNEVVNNTKPQLSKVTLEVEGMMCEHCVGHVEEACKKVDNVVSAKASLKKKNVEIEYEENIDLEKVKTAIEEAGYKAK